jgi:ATP-dependent protease ClpP protease subunit
MRFLRVLMLLAIVSIPTHGYSAPPSPTSTPEVFQVKPLGGFTCHRRPCVVMMRFEETVTSESVERVTDMISAANAVRADNIVLEIDTVGGRVDAGFKLVKAIENSRAPVTCVVDYQAYSMGFYILQGCHERVMTRRAVLMAHEVRDGQVNENVIFADRYESLAAHLRALSRAYAEHCSRRMGMTVADYLTHVGGAKDWFMGHEDAIKYHAVDRVVVNPREVYEDLAKRR